MLGRWLSINGDDVDAIVKLARQAKREKVADPIGWIEARLTPSPKARGSPYAHPNDVYDPAKVLAELERRQAERAVQ